MTETKLAVRHTVGNDTVIMKLFELNQMEEAKSYAQREAQNYDAGNMVVMSAAFWKGTKQRADGRMLLYEVYPCHRCRS